MGEGGGRRIEGGVEGKSYEDLRFEKVGKVRSEGEEAVEGGDLDIEGGKAGWRESVGGLELVDGGRGEGGRRRRGGGGRREEKGHEGEEEECNEQERRHGILLAAAAEME